MLSDMVKVKNILTIYNYIHDLLPDCFRNEFHLLANTLYLCRYQTIRSRLFAHWKKIIYQIWYELYSKQGIQNWNTTTKLFKCNLAMLPRNQNQISVIIFLIHTLRELIFAGIKFRDFLQNLLNLILAEIMKICKFVKFAKDKNFH